MDHLVHDLFDHDQPGDKKGPQYRGNLMRITVSGLPGSGTTSLSRYLAENHGFTMISVREVFRECAKEHNMELAEFGRLAEKDAAYDKMIDARAKRDRGEKRQYYRRGAALGLDGGKSRSRIVLFAPIACRGRKMDRFPRPYCRCRDGKGDHGRREHCEAVRTGYDDIDIRISPSTTLSSTRSTRGSGISGR